MCADTERVSPDKGSEAAYSGDTPDNAPGAGTGQIVEDMQVVTTLEIKVVEDSLRLGAFRFSILHDVSSHVQVLWG